MTGGYDTLLGMSQTELVHHFAAAGAGPRQHAVCGPVRSQVSSMLTHELCVRLRHWEDAQGNNLLGSRVCVFSSPQAFACETDQAC